MVFGGIKMHKAKKLIENTKRERARSPRYDCYKEHHGGTTTTLSSKAINNLRSKINPNTQGQQYCAPQRTKNNTSIFDND